MALALFDFSKIWKMARGLKLKGQTLKNRLDKILVYKLGSNQCNVFLYITQLHDVTILWIETFYPISLLTQHHTHSVWLKNMMQYTTHNTYVVAK